MKEVKTEILINSSPEKVWDILTNFEQQPSWNPFISKITGEKKVGKNLKVSIEPPNGKGMTFSPVVLKYQTNKEFRWKGKLLTKGIFDGEHYFILSQEGKDQTKFVHGEKFSGILVALFGKLLDKTKEGFELMNKALKVECEK